MVEVTDLYGDGVVNGVDVADGSCYDEAVVQTMADLAGADLNGAGEGLQPYRHAKANGRHCLSFYFDRLLRVEEVSLRL